MHSHDCGCNHELRYCAHCDVVYCVKCKREWGQYYNYQWPYKWYYCGGSSLSAIATTPNYTSQVSSTTVCSHQ